MSSNTDRNQLQYTFLMETASITSDYGNILQHLCGQELFCEAIPVTVHGACFTLYFDVHTACQSLCYPKRMSCVLLQNMDCFRLFGLWLSVYHIGIKMMCCPHPSVQVVGLGA